jgi:hypothetical protein
MQYLELTAGVVDGVLVIFPCYLIIKNAPFKTNQRFSHLTYLVLFYLLFTGIVSRNNNFFEGL